MRNILNYDLSYFLIFFIIFIIYYLYIFQKKYVKQFERLMKIYLENYGNSVVFFININKRKNKIMIKKLNNI